MDTLTAPLRFTAILACVLLLFLIHVKATDITVKTNVGYFIGVKQDVSFAGSTRPIAKFLGIPYAEPPVGAFRFRRPRPKKPLREAMVVQKFSDRCIEMFAILNPGPESEDCLFLNVYVPDGFATESLPVMVFIHGGGFQFGSSNIYDPDFLTAFGRVIVVTINYRLNIFGFLSTEDDSAYGNYGLWDQHLAIQWVHDNIEAFGGDAGRVTVFGESAGAVSVILQGLYRGNDGLFQRMLALSGSPSAAWVQSNNPKKTAEEFATTVGCYNESADVMVECLRSLSDSIIRNSLHNASWPTAFMFRPVTDSMFISCDPADVLNVDLNSEGFNAARANFASIDLMMGVNSGEGVFDMKPWNGYGDIETFLPNKTYFDEVLVPILAHRIYGDSVSDAEMTSIVEKITETYTDEADPTNPERIREQFIYMHGDANQFAPTQDTLKAHAKHSSRNTHMYLFNVKPIFHILPTPTWFNGANHADELLYLFRSAPLSDQYVTLTQKMIAMVTNFAKTGDPNHPVDIGVAWEPYTTSHPRYLEITRNMTAQNLKEDLAKDRVELWNVILPELVGDTAEPCKYKYSISGTPRKFQQFNFVVVILCSVLCTVIGLVF